MSEQTTTPTVEELKNEQKQQKKEGQRLRARLFFIVPPIVMTYIITAVSGSIDFGIFDVLLAIALPTVHIHTFAAKAQEKIVTGSVIYSAVIALPLMTRIAENNIIILIPIALGVLYSVFSHHPVARQMANDFIQTLEQHDDE